MGIDIQSFMVDAIVSLIITLKGMVWPAVFFLCVGYIVKRGALWDDIRRSLPEAKLCLQLMVFNLFVTVPFLVLFAQGFHSFVLHHGLTLFEPDDWANWPVWVVIPMAIFIGDFTGYWRHRFEHTAVLWPSHAVHHSDTEMTWLTLERFHPLNRLTTMMIDSSVLLAMGMPAYAVVANGFVRHYYGYVIHADLPWTYGRASWIFVSPAMHRWHHSLDKRFFQTNFATVFSVFDRAFGTYRVPGPCTSPLGVTDDMAPTLSGQLGYMFQPRAYKRVVSGFRRLRQRVGIGSPSPR